MKSFDILVMVMLGGLGSTTGEVIAAAFITVLTAALQSFPATGAGDQAQHSDFG